MLSSHSYRAEELNLKLAAPIETWDEAIPLGNGLLGGLIWGRGNTIRLSLDRGDLWDVRIQDEFKKTDCTWKTMQRLVAEKNKAELVRRFEVPYETRWPTKLPGGRLELNLDPSQRITSFSLDLAHAVGRAELGRGSQMEAFVSAVAPSSFDTHSRAGSKGMEVDCSDRRENAGVFRSQGRERWQYTMVLAGGRRRVSLCRDGIYPTRRQWHDTSRNDRCQQRRSRPNGIGTTTLGWGAAGMVTRICSFHTRLGGELSGRGLGLNCLNRITCNIITSCSIFSDRLPVWMRRRCHCRAYGPRTTAACHHGRAIITMILILRQPTSPIRPQAISTRGAVFWIFCGICCRNSAGSPTSFTTRPAGCARGNDPRRQAPRRLAHVLVEPHECCLDWLSLLRTLAVYNG